VVATDCEVLAKLLSHHRFGKRYCGTAERPRFIFKCRCGFKLGPERKTFHEYFGNENTITQEELTVWETHISEILFVELNEES